MSVLVWFRLSFDTVLKELKFLKVCATSLVIANVRGNLEGKYRFLDRELSIWAQNAFRLVHNTPLTNCCHISVSLKPATRHLPMIHCNRLQVTLKMEKRRQTIKYYNSTRSQCYNNNQHNYNSNSRQATED